jgi:hypothetical protein
MVYIFFIRTMKIYPGDARTQQLLREIQQIESYIEEHKNVRGCLYWIYLFDEYRFLYNRLKKLRAELSYFIDD